MVHRGARSRRQVAWRLHVAQPVVRRGRRALLAYEGILRLVAVRSSNVGEGEGGQGPCRRPLGTWGARGRCKSAGSAGLVLAASSSIVWRHDSKRSHAERRLCCAEFSLTPHCACGSTSHVCIGVAIRGLFRRVRSAAAQRPASARRTQPTPERRHMDWLHKRRDREQRRPSGQPTAPARRPVSDPAVFVQRPRFCTQRTLIWVCLGAQLNGISIGCR